MMGLSTEQAEAVKRQERKRIPLGRRGRPNDVSRWIISLADWITGVVLAVDGGLDLVWPRSHSLSFAVLRYMLSAPCCT
jgi:NAD(P)-dependent dehydrogenase (short-subunit alcohol dehydrogenase family)